MIKLAAIALVVTTTARARADGPLHWWQQFYVTTGYRDLRPLHTDASAVSFSLGYRLERGAWGVDLALFDEESKFGAGLQEIGRLTAYRNVLATSHGNLWFGGGAGYYFTRGYDDSDLPEHTAHGFGLAVTGGFDLPRWHDLAGFMQVVVSAPISPTRDVYNAADSEVRVVAFNYAIGMRW